MSTSSPEVPGAAGTSAESAASTLRDKATSTMTRAPGPYRRQRSRGVCFGYPGDGWLAAIVARHLDATSERTVPGK